MTDAVAASVDRLGDESDVEVLLEDEFRTQQVAGVNIL